MKDGNTLRNVLKVRLHYFLSLILLLHTLFYLVYWLSIGSLRQDVNQFIAGFTGLSVPYTTILIILTAIVFLWSMVRFIGFRLALKKPEWKPAIVNWIYFGVWALFLFLFYFSFWLIIRENPSQKGVIYQLVNLMRVGADPLLFLVAAIWLRRLLLLLRKKAFQAKKRLPWGLGIGLVLLLLVGLWLLPTLLPPNWAYQGDLPAKPALIAHRGASMLAPENTLAAAEMASNYGAFGFETDVRISLDGVPFLMHDGTLLRTTNIAEVYPERANDDASSFTVDEIRALNAGLWFIQKDPFNMIESGLISQAQLSINQGQKIPTLEQALEFVKEQEMVILFDLRYPPQDHPYHDQFFEIVFDQCKESGINGDVWFLVDRQNLDIVLEEAPQMTRVIGVSSTNLPDPGTLLELNYEIVNIDTGIIKEEILAYRQDGLGVNIYTIDQPWLFSQFWLSGVTSVTTNNIHTLTQLERPSLDLPYSRFLLFWALFGIIIAIWLASSRPNLEKDPAETKNITTPDLMDFAMEADPGSEGHKPDEDTDEEGLKAKHRSEINNYAGIDNGKVDSKNEENE